MHCSALSSSMVHVGLKRQKTFHLSRLLGKLTSIPQKLPHQVSFSRSKMSIPESARGQDENHLCSNKKANQNGSIFNHEYSECIKKLNLLQSNTQAIALAKYKVPKDILPLFEKQLNLAGIQLEELNKLNVIHVSGTKGKGSTCAFLESILREHGLKTGFYNSPHLVKVTERIKINGQPIDESKFSKYFRQVYDRLQIETKSANLSMPSYFSFLTILAFHTFLEEKVDCSVIEVGIGGEFDPTNIVQQPVACAITTLDYDHTNILGKTIEDIAWSKAGIVKTGVPLFTVEHEQNKIIDVIKARSYEKLCPLYICRPLKQGDLKLGIKGSAQYTNAALACQLADYFLEKAKKQEPDSARPQTSEQLLDIDLKKLPPQFSEALSKCFWPGRCQILKYPGKTFFLDGAHTRKSMENCLEWFLEESKVEDKSATRILLVNVIGERNKLDVLRPLANSSDFELVIFSTNRINSAGDTPKSQTFVNIQSPSSEKSMENVSRNVEAWKTLLMEMNKNEGKIVIKSNTFDSINYIDEMIGENPQKSYHILVTGSLHFVGAILETLSAENLNSFQ